MPPKGKYTDPKLRDQVKEEIHQGDKGGAPGQWSARKAQMMASEYKKRGGGYTTDKKDQDDSQKHLSKWTEEEWQTKEGSGHAKQEDGSRKRYLPKKAWEKMSEEEKRETDEKKLEESKEGKQHVGNTEKARRSRRKANNEEDEKSEEKKTGQKKANQKRKRAASKEVEEQDDEGHVEDDAEAEYVNDAAESAGSEEGEGDDGEGEEKDEKKPKAGQKRGRGRPPKTSLNKKQKTDSSKGKQNGKVGSKKGKAEPPAKPGSKDRLPKKGQKVHWHSLPGYIEGEVVEIVYEDKEVEGKRVRGGKDDPRIVLKSSSSGKIATHKPEAVFFD